jgi:hypothetical protein
MFLGVLEAKNEHIKIRFFPVKWSSFWGILRGNLGGEV